MTVLAIEPEAKPTAIPAAWAKAAAVKLERDRQSYAEFRAADQQQHERAHKERLTTAVAGAEDKLRLWREDIGVREPEAAETLAAFRAAEDRAREAVKFAAQKRAEYERIKGKASPEEETDAAIRADTADNVAADAAEVTEQKRAGLAEADQGLAGAREALAAAERALDRARKAAKIPAGTAAISDVTIRACAAHMQADEVWATLSTADKQRVRLAVQPRDMMSGRDFLAMLGRGFGTGAAS